MKLQAKIQVGEKGRIVIPVEMREALGIKAGDTIEMRYEDHEVKVSTVRSRIRRVQERAKQFVKPGTLVSEELSAERREAARNE
jgi:AbrB family looped-hinge helix DNA binding protein